MVIRRVLLLLAALLGLVMVGCSGPPAEELYAAGEKAAADSTTQAAAVDRFSELVRRYPQHPLAAKALKHLAMISQQRGQMQAAIEQYQRLLRDYPNSGEGDEAQFMIAFIYEEYLKDYTQARAAYQAVIDKYPGSELAASAERLLPNVGRDPEEWVQFQDSVAPARAP